mmetsp:Transcript_27961/g.47513  ORF Transcript_27961/g.47513 Transcript_27961/m.47513 type:complete len:802 (+) Transcript_27961:55-2460(+)
MAPLLTCSSCNNLHPKTSYSKSQWALGPTGKAQCSRCIYMEKTDVVDFQPVEDAPLTPPGPEMKKILEGGGVVVEEEEIDRSEGSRKSVTFAELPLTLGETKEEEVIVDEDSNNNDNNDNAAAAIPVVLSSSGDPIAVYEDEVVDDSAAPEALGAPPEEELEGESEESSSVKTEESSEEKAAENNEEDEEEEEDEVPYVAAAAVGAAAAAASANNEDEPDVEMGGDPIAVYEDKVNDDDDAPRQVRQGEAAVVAAAPSGEYEESSSEETQSASSEEETESASSEEEEEDVAPYVAAAVVGGAAAAAAASSANEEEPDVEMGHDADEMGEQFNLANEEYRNEVVLQDDEEQGLQMEDTVAGAPLSPIAEKSVEKDDPSFASAGTATQAAVVADTTNEDEQRRVVSSSRDSCCKRHKCMTFFIVLVILFVIAAVVLIVLFLVGPLKHPASQESPRKGTTTGLCSVLDLGPFYQSECVTCSHSVAMDAETGLIGRGGGNIQFLPNAGTYIPGQILPFISHEASALSGNYAALGDPNAAGLGTVYMYERDLAGVWSDVWNITPFTLNVLEAKFGSAIALYADKMVVGAPGDVNEGGVSTGSVYVYGRADAGNWIEEAKLYQTIPTGNFGSAVAMQGDTLVVADAAFPGTLYVYQYDSTANSWEQPIGGTLSSVDCRSTFGTNVGVTDGGGILVECPKDKENTGVVYYYTPSSDGSGYELSQKITAFNDLPLPVLGEKIVVDKDRLLVTTGAESAFVFELDGGEWKEAALIAAPAGANNFGIDAALSGDHIFLSYSGNTHSYILEC